MVPGSTRSAGDEHDTWEPTVWLRRTIALLVDASAAMTIGDLLTGQILAPGFAIWEGLVTGLVFFGYRLGFEALSGGGSVGKNICGIRVANASGGPPSFIATLQRATIVTLVIGMDPYRVLRSLTGDVLPAAWGGLTMGIAVAYLVVCLVTAVRAKRARLFHDTWTRTRITFADQQSQPESSDVGTKYPRGLKWILGLGGVCGLVLLITVQSGSLKEKLLGIGKAPPSSERSFERLIEDDVKVRNKVSLMTGTWFSTNTGSQKLLTLEVSLPYGAGAAGMVPRVRQVVVEHLQIDPTKYGRVEVKVSAKLGGLLQMEQAVSTVFTWNQQSMQWE